MEFISTALKEFEGLGQANEYDGNINSYGKYECIFIKIKQHIIFLKLYKLVVDLTIFNNHNR